MLSFCFQFIRGLDCERIYKLTVDSVQPYELSPFRVLAVRHRLGWLSARPKRRAAAPRYFQDMVL